MTKARQFKRYTSQTVLEDCGRVWTADIHHLQVVKGDEEAQAKLPEVMKQALKSASSPSQGKREYHTSARRSAEQETALVEAGEMDVVAQGLKYELPPLPLPSNLNLKHRYDPVVQQVTNLLMRDGKLSVAQRVCTCPLSLMSSLYTNLRRAKLMPSIVEHVPHPEPPPHSSSTYTISYSSATSGQPASFSPSTSPNPLPYTSN